MREILFRGKRVDNGEWETGSLVIIRGGCSDVQVFIADKMTGYHTPVIPDTIGQYIGLTDKNGKMIFEGDIVLATLKFFNINNEKCKVIFHNGSFGVQYGFSTDYFKTFPAWDEVEVIDNIYDNPELLGGDDNDNHT